jgi:parallel beta-helix repeat protein
MKRVAHRRASGSLARSLLLLLSLPAITAVAAARHSDRIPPGMILKSGALEPMPVVMDGQEPATGLQREFRPILTRTDNPCTPARVELGRLLFFDPILSGKNDMSCANCHHPDLGFSDGLPRARGFGSMGFGGDRRGGVELPRHAPGLWNTLYNPAQFWDGRAKDLEDQAQGPITAKDEMGGDKESVVRKLRGIAEYRRLFNSAFGGSNGSGITFDHVVYAIADFERTFVANNTRYDRYAAGDAGALTPSEKRGLKVFLSTKTRCSECHGIPEFANPDFKVIGVPNVPGFEDPHNPAAPEGRGGGPVGAFKIPTLRNVALRAPYMHNGVFKTLDEVLKFYENGGGRGLRLVVPLQDDKIRKYTITPEEKSDLIAFLNSLTDVSAIPQFPRRVPSGLPVVRRLRNPALARAERAEIRLASLAMPRLAQSPARETGRIVDVHEGQSIQDAVEAAGRNGTVRVFPGVYHENVLVIQHGVTIRGVSENGRRPVMDGRNDISDGIVDVGNRFTVENIDFKDFQENGVVAHGVKRVAFRDLSVRNPGTYAVYPVSCDGVTVERCFVSGSKDAGIYVGQSRNIVVRNNEVTNSVAGIEIENSSNSLVENNFCHDNVGGILVFVLPFNPSKVCQDNRLLHNRIVNNNLPNFADPNAIVRNVLRGTGVMILAADRTEVAFNDIENNGSFAVAVSGLDGLFPRGTNYDVKPTPDDNWIHDNLLKNNATNPDERLDAVHGAKACDLLYDLSGTGNGFDQPGATSFPGKLSSRRPEAFANAR